MSNPQPTPDIRTTVREHYGQIAENFKPSQAASCCGSPANAISSCCGSSSQTLDPDLKIYETPDVANLPPEVTELSLGCGDPVTLAALKPGQSVLDLGSGGGIDCFLAARQVGEAGHVIGVDMTPAMLEKARLNQQRLGLKNVEFRLGEIEHLPVADGTIDVILSNCVVNLSPDKPQVFREAFRVLRSGGRLSVSDIVTNGPLPAELKASLSAWAGCVAGALEVQEYTDAIRAAGFEDISIVPVYLPKETVDQALTEIGQEIPAGTAQDDEIYKTVFSAKITARKP